jgi:hypothetical protein
MKHALISLFALAVFHFSTPSNAILFPVEPNQQWIYSFWDTDGNKWIETVDFTSTATIDSLEYVVASDGWAIHSTDTSVTGFEDINDLSSYFSFTLDSSTPIESISTSYGNFETAYIYHTIDPEHEVWDHFVQDVGYVYLIENWHDDNGNVVLTEFAELIEIRTVSEPSVLLLYVAGLLGLYIIRRQHLH